MGSGSEESESPTEIAKAADEYSGADLWEESADEHERLADERERLADEREALASERERLADRFERSLDKRQSEWLSLASAGGDLDEEIERAETLAALGRAEAAVERAEAELVRVRLAADRLSARADLRKGGLARGDAARSAAASVDADELSWLRERRDFIATERERGAAERDRLADERDEMAGRRERLADERDHAALERERRLDQLGPTPHPDRKESGSTHDVLRLQAEERARAEMKRKTAAARRRFGAQLRARAASVWGPKEYGPKLIASFGELAKQLFVSEELSDVLPRLLKFTVGAVSGCDSASVTLWRHGRFVDTVASAATAAELDELQFGTELGPALDALHEDHPVHVPNLAESTRWPVLAATAAQLGVASVLSYGLFVHRAVQWSALGTFSLYSAAPDAFGDEDQEFGSILAAYLSVAVAMAQRRDEIDRREAALHRGLGTRDVIGQAKGILMERQRLSAGDAFDVLRRASQRLNRKVTDVAMQLAETGELP
jgi:ANTAR domain